LVALAAITKDADTPPIVTTVIFDPEVSDVEPVKTNFLLASAAPKACEVNEKELAALED